MRDQGIRQIIAIEIGIEIVTGIAIEIEKTQYLGISDQRVRDVVVIPYV